MKKLFLLSVFVFLSLVGKAQTTYTWIGASGGSWAVSTNWSPTRTTPATTDIIQFNSGTTLTVTAVPTQTIRQLLVSGNTDVSLQSTGTVTLTITAAASSNALTVASGSTLQLSSITTNVFNLAFGVATTPNTNIAGTIIINANTALTNTLNFTNLTAANNTITGTITNNGGNITSTAATTTFGSGVCLQTKVDFSLRSVLV